MIKGLQFIEKAKEFYSFLDSEFKMQVVNETIRESIFYDLQYGNEGKIISISYENLEDYFQVIVFILLNGQLPDYDDKTRTLHLNILNSNILPIINIEEIESNNMYFINFKATSEVEKKLLKSAKELRLCLKHMN